MVKKGQGTHLSGRRVRSSRSTRSMPRILVPLSETVDTRMSMTEMSTSSPSSTFQLLRRYACSPKHQPSATTWGCPCDHLSGSLGAPPAHPYMPAICYPLHLHCHLSQENCCEDIVGEGKEDALLQERADHAVHCSLLGQG